MKITDLLNERSIKLDGKAMPKNETIDIMVDLMYASGNLNDKAVYKKCVLAREDEGTTGIGEGVAIPHAKTDAVRSAGLCAMVVKDGTDYDSLDGKPVQLIFLIAAPNTADNVHLDVLGRLSVLLMDDEFRHELISAKTTKEFLSIIEKAEIEKFSNEVEEKPKSGYRILAVTACPTGIAHTYMAAESLETTAAEMGVSIKVETNGSGGVKNQLTVEEIKNCDCIIVAADKNVETARFNGKPVIFTKVANGIHKSKQLIEDGLSGNAKIYHSDKTATVENENEGVGRQIYKHLMNGVSHMLPFVIGGGILIALSFLLDGANAGTAVFGTGNTTSLFFNEVGNLAFSMMFPILAGFIAMSIGDRPALMIGIVGGLIAKEGVSVFTPQADWISSGFFGALIAGFVAGYMMLGLKKICAKLPKALEGTKPVLIYPVLGVLMIGLIMVFVVNPPVGMFNTWLYSLLNSMNETSRIILGLVLGGMMSIDFGGPFNKAAYVFGTAAIAEGGFGIMAAVMVGGMVPPLAIALCTTFFKNRFTIKERQTTITNYIMGLSFITEGAIPFAASDPLRIIPPCVVGSAVAGGLSMLFGCGAKAPHGGIFVVAIMDRAPMFLLSLLIGSIVAMLLIAVMKKPLSKEQSGLK